MTSRQTRRYFTISASALLSALVMADGAMAQREPAPQHSLVGSDFTPHGVDREHPVYETSFENEPVLKDWKLEGGKRASISSGHLVLESEPREGKAPEDPNHLVFWLKKEMPADYLLEFTVRPQNRQEGLNIVFLNARAVNGASIFDPAIQPRTGVFKQYHSGDLKNYHISYWAAGRGFANLRKNHGFHLAASGIDYVASGKPQEFQTVQVYKRGGQIRAMVDGKVAVAFDDDGETYGPVHTHSGWVGLRQMGHTLRCEYGYFKVFPLVLAFVAPSARAEIMDDFSRGGWRGFSSTPGEMSIEPGKMRLVDAPGEPEWMTASKTFTVDFEKTPFFLVKVADVSDYGTVKLIRKKPYDKKAAFNIDRPGLYAVDMRSQFGWNGVGEVETCLYANGDEEETTYEFVKYTAKLSQEEESLIKARATTGNTRLHVEAFEVVPLFNTCSFYLPGPRPDALSVTYRKKGENWLEALEPPYMAEDDMVRGSIVDLDENTSYEIRITGDHGEILAQKEFRTWRSDIPISKTIVLDEACFPGQLTIRDNGSPDGWIKYTARKGFVLRNERTGPLLELYKAKYVILEGLKLRGGLKEAVSITKCEHVRIVNCDIAGWGRIGTQRFDLDGKYYTEDGRAVNWDSAILVKRSTGTVVERCYIHDPVNTANPWYYSHPAGPQAVGIDKPRSTVIRYNDFVGSDLHRWNDAIEGAGNFHVDGGFNRDADIYGNLMCFANDDAIEIDGGQTNVRVFLNKLEGCLCGVSIQGCMSSPSYVFRNLLVNMGDENGVGGQTIKTSSFANGKSAVSFIFNNTCYGDSSDLSLPHNLRIVARNNIFAGRSAISGRSRSPQSNCDYNLLSTGEDGDEEHGILTAPEFLEARAGLFELTDTSPAIGRGMAIPNFAAAENGRVDMGAIPFDSGLVLPVRPIPVVLDRYQLVFPPPDSVATSAQRVTAAVNGEGFSSEYRIAQNEAFDWFHVSPRSGTLQSGRKVTFTVTLVPEKMQNRSIYRGAFLIRLASGYSRPVMVYAEADVVPTVKPSREGVFVEYLEAETPFGTQSRGRVQDALASRGTCFVLSGDTSKGTAEYRFSVPKAGKYFVLMRIRSDEPVGAHDTIRFAVDDGQLDEACLLSATSWGWSLVAHNRKQRLTRLQAFELSAGEHVLKLAARESIYIDMIAVTDNPAMFD